MMLRTLVAFAWLPIFFLSIFVAPLWVLVLILTGFSVLMAWEILWPTGFVRHKGLVSLACITASGMQVWTYFNRPFLPAAAVIFAFIFIVFFMGIFWPGKVSFISICGTFFAALVMPFLLSFMIGILQLERGIYLIMIPFIAAWVSDTFAYFAGTLIGKHKLIPAISPKKTVEGSVAGIIGAVLGEIIYGLVLIIGLNMKADLLILAVFGAVGSCTGQIGDLALSYIKRQFGIKDYGNLFMSHGGVLDRFDSALFTLPALYIVVGLMGVM